mmetsp:Transcript_16440/g.24534  ORF Transcript_16440/g.24534 Transcript_16440/m.24534 type:complete len:104 (+) Transcript_16440:1052-1363(+)
MSLLAKNSPNATSLLLVTPRGGGLDTNVWIIGRSMVSWSMSLKSAVATSRTTRLRRRVCGMVDLLPPPRMVVSSDDESFDDLEDTSRLADIAQSLFDVNGWES